MEIVEFELWYKCHLVAHDLLSKGYPLGEMDLDKLTDILVKLELEKIEKNAITDRNINYNDEILEFEDMGELETIDISVSGDNLFYCNNILTKNSFALPATADFMLALVTSEELESLGQIMAKQLKNRYTDLGKCRRFVLGIDRVKMKLYDVEEDAQDLVDDRPVMDKSEFGQRDNVKKKKFGLNDFEGFK